MRSGAPMRPVAALDDYMQGELPRATDHPRTLMHFSASLGNISQLRDTTFFSYGIPRVKVHSQLALSQLVILIIMLCTVLCMSVFRGRGRSLNWPPSKKLTLKNAAWRSATPQYRRIYNSTAIDECKWHNCWLKLRILPCGAMLWRHAEGRNCGPVDDKL